MILARTLSGTIARSEASLGRYVISTDKQQGQLYYAQWRLAGEQISRLDKLARDNRAQRRRIEQLRAAYDERGDELSLIALSTSYGKNSQALGRYYASRDAPSLARINDLLNDLIEAERRLLDNRTTQAMETVRLSSTIARFLSVFGLMLVLGAVALGALIVSAMTERAVAQAEAEAERARADELAEAVSAATQEIHRQESRLRQGQKMEAVGQLTGGIAHDFNNMLAVVLGGLELARRSLSTGDGDLQRYIDSASEGATRAAALTRQLLAFSREEAINPEIIDVGNLLAGMRDLLDRTLGDGITVEIRDDSAGWPICADRNQFENTILNLAVNARDAMDGRGALTITATARTLGDHEQGACGAGDHVAIAVRDTGCGMAPAVVERALEPFFTTKPVGKGTGLGLSQIFAFARQGGGDIAIESVEGTGTIVTLYLPREIKRAATRAHQPIADDVPDHDQAALTILLVEDDPRVLAAAEGALEELGHRVITCDDPRHAAERLNAAPRVDLIMSDVLMPNLTGPEMIAALPARYGEVAVLFVTGFAGETGNAGEFGGRPVLRKPYTLVALERAIATALHAGRHGSTSRIAAE